MPDRRDGTAAPVKLAKTRPRSDCIAGVDARLRIIEAQHESASGQGGSRIDQPGRDGSHELVSEL